jgi:hypothetical protein
MYLADDSESRILLTTLEQTFFQLPRFMSYVPPSHSKLTRNPFLPDPPPASRSRSSDRPPVQEDRKLKEFNYDLFSKSGKPWATLVLRGDAEHSRGVPAFLEGSLVTGEVRLNLESGDAIHAVLLSVRPPLGIMHTTNSSYLAVKGPGHNRGDPERDGVLYRPANHVVVAVHGGPSTAWRAPQMERTTQGEIRLAVLCIFTDNGYPSVAGRAGRSVSSAADFFRTTHTRSNRVRGRRALHPDEVTIRPQVCFFIISLRATAGIK